MTCEKTALLNMAKESLKAAQLLADRNMMRFAVSRAYYSMFYCAQAVLLTKQLSFSKHAGVIAAFGKEFVKQKLLPEKLHRYLIESAELREEGDYDVASEIDADTCYKQLTRAEEFIACSRDYLKSD